MPPFCNQLSCTLQEWKGENGDGCEAPASEPSPLFLSPLSPPLPYSHSISSCSSSFFFSLIRPCSSTSTNAVWILSAFCFSIFFFSSRSAMRGTLRWLSDLVESEPYDSYLFGGLFLEDGVPASFVSSISTRYFRNSASVFGSSRRPGSTIHCEIFGPGRKGVSERLRSRFLSVSFSINGGEGNGVCVQDSEEPVEQSENKSSKEKVVQYQVEDGRVRGVRERGSGALNTTKHLWAGAVAAMVSRTFVAPLERLKLEYIVRGEQRNLIELIKKIAASQGLKGFWKGNVVNILRTAPFKSINFYAYDSYRSQLMKITGNEDTTNFERFVAGAAAGITATVLCIPMDTIRTKMVAPGGEALGGIIGAFRHMIQNEGFFSLYKGLVPSIISMAPSGAVFYGAYDILKSAYLNSPEGRKRIQHRKEEAQVLNALEKLEMGPARTLLYGAIAGACAEAATYPFEVVRRQLQMQVRATKLNALATCVKIVEQGGVPALYAGLIPSLLQVLPSAAISYFVYEFMKIVLKVESA